MDVYALPVPGAGGKTCAQIFEEAGCDTPTSPSCGACLGGPADTYARLNEPQVRNRFLPYLSKKKILLDRLELSDMRLVLSDSYSVYFLQ